MSVQSDISLSEGEERDGGLDKLRMWELCYQVICVEYDVFNSEALLNAMIRNHGNTELRNHP